MNIEREQKYIKTINVLSFWKENCLESKYPNFHTINLLYLLPLRHYESCIITVSSVTITNWIRELIYFEYLEINGIKYLVGNKYYYLNPALFSIELDECLLGNFQVQ
jgi:hypothetical protein